MFKLFTGAPGSGKTLSLMNELKDGVFYPNTKNKRPVYYYGIPDVISSLGWIAMDDPKNWHELVPDGAIVVIDEVQEHFPVRPAKNPVPSGLQAIEKHRHRGLDIYFLTQHPSLLDHHARRLVNEHWHLKRNFGANFSVLYRANECMADPQDYHTLQKAEKTTFKYPKDVFNLYKSAEVHTHKFRMPKVIYLLGILILFVVAMIFYFVNTLFPDDSSNTLQSPKSLLSKSLHNNPERYNKTITVDSFLPQINNTPASSPFYLKKWKPKSIPIISSCMGTSDHCQCYTQQGTRYITSKEYCISVLANGSTFDHTLPDNRFSNKQKSSKDIKI